MNHFLWPPNWKSPVVERLEYLTDVQQSSNGTEVRVPLRTAPRSSLTFEIFAEGADAIRLRNFIQTHQGKKVMIPWWVSGFKWEGTAYAMLNVHTKLGISSTFALGFGPVGSQVLIVKDDKQQWVRALTISNGSHLGISSATWPLPGPERPGVMLYPMIECYMNASQSLTNPTGNILHGSITFEAAEIVPHESATLSTQLNGVPVLIEGPNRAQDHTIEYNRLVAELDFMTGKRSHYDHSGQSFRTVSHEYALQEYREIIPFKAFLNHLQGRKGSLYLPSFSCDYPNFSIVANLFNPVQINYDDVGYRSLPNQPQAFWIESNKNNHFREVTTITAQAGGKERITGNTVAAVVGEDFLGAQILYKSRLASDTVEIVWHSSAVATINLPFRTIRT